MKIDSFHGEYRWLSNFWSVNIFFEGEWYTSVEHAYQASKTKDPNVRKEIRRAQTPGIAKRLARGLVGRLDPKWEEQRLKIMEELLRQKFAIPKLALLLDETGDVELIEGNTWNDRFWGVDLQGKGENNLGKLIMKIRKERRKK